MQALHKSIDYIVKTITLRPNTKSLESIRSLTEEYVIKQFFCQFYNISDFLNKFQEIQKLLFCRLKKMTLLTAVHRVYLLTIFC